MGYFKRFYIPKYTRQPVERIVFQPLTDEDREWLRREKERRDTQRQKEEIERQLRAEEKRKRLEFTRHFRAWIYFAQEPINGFIKIGVSKRIYLDDRFYELRRRYGADLRFLGAFEGDAKEERILHKILASFRTSQPRDEWFYPEYPVLLAAKYLCDSDPSNYWPEQEKFDYDGKV